MPRTRVTASHRAWVVLLAAFLAFCLLCGITLYGVNFFLFQSTVPMQVTLDVGRGTAAYLLSSDPDENVAPATGHFVAMNERVRLDGQSQATLFVRDGFQANRLIASVTMSGANGSNAQFGFAQRPRFEWSGVEYRIDLHDIVGDFDIYVPPGLDRALVLRLRTPQDGVVYITGAGNYSVSASANRLQAFNRDGTAYIQSPDENSARLIASGQDAMMSFETPAPEIAFNPGPLNLLPPANLLTNDVDTLTQTETLLADLLWPWQCGGNGAEPPSIFDVGIPDGRPGIHFFRTGAINPSEVGCSQSPGPSQTGRDVRESTSLVFKTTFYIENHSVSLCGIDGSECPLMLRLDYKYTDAEGNELTDIWYHGFYTRTDPNTDYPTRCSSCIVDHDPVYPGTWYTYESPNLLSLISEAQRPETLLRVRFYASGHEYDVYVSDLALFLS